MAKSSKGHDPVKKGYHKMDFGGEEKMNHRVNAYAGMNATPTKKPNTKVKKTAKNNPYSPMFSGAKKGK